MDELSKERLAEMRHSYELGMLSERERREFEMYILEHDDLLQDMEEFKDIIRLLREDASIRDTIAELAAASPEPRPRRRIFGRALVPSFVVIVLALILLMAKPWTIDIHPDREAMAAANRIAIPEFAQIGESSDVGALGEISASLLAADLAESKFLQVIPTQRLRDILDGLDTTDQRLPDEQAAQEIARRAEARWHILGTIEQSLPTVIISARIVETATGVTISQPRVEGADGQSLFEVIDMLSRRVKNGLKLPDGADQEADKPVTSLTSNSLAAYRFYLEGIKYYNKLYAPEAAQAFKLALEYDSTLAMAYYYLAYLTDPTLIEKALQYADHTGSVQRQYILASRYRIDGQLDSAVAILEALTASHPDEKMAFYLAGQYLYTNRQYADAIQYLRQAIHIDPRYTPAYNILSYAYSQSGDVENALAAINTYVSLAPNEANPYDTKGDIFLSHNMLDSAIAAYNRALDITPEFRPTAIKLGHIYFFLQRFDSAKVYYQRVSRIGTYFDKSEARLYLACIPLFQGRVMEALSRVDDCITADVVENGEEYYPSFRCVRGFVYHELGQLQKAINELEQAIDIHIKHFPPFYFTTRALFIEIVSQTGDVDRAQALTDQLARDIDTTGYPRLLLDYAEASIAEAAGDFDRAIEGYSRAVGNVALRLPAYYRLGHLYRETGQPTEAADVYRRMTDRYAGDYPLWSLLAVKSHYHLAIVFEELGRPDDAVLEYRAFLDLWKNADYDFPEIEDARRRLTRLESTL